ncbi:ABC transporter substrate-binding protein [Muricoccus pecuniae]|uniref:Peptide/nickel transport system substrate-binding protein n=1 Tax=Muricoccus pecuniae TaxID=693023 RepID=A0A840Y6Y0_9PROT|nr:ABC transporter substrate-binding protein [Roseomonas pecuniae]MBB5696495.1 peptide/nickel transport system substrate-binding protein [Roseomonas pecuniae]
MQRRSLLSAPLGLAAGAGLSRPALVAAQGQRVLKFIPQSDLVALDPVWTTAYVTRNHGYMVFDTLFGTDANLRPVPQMAEGATTEDGGRTWRIVLRPGLTFHNGSAVLARDCVASIQRWGRRDAFGQALLAATNELSAPDDRTVLFRLKAPFPLLPNALGKAPSFMCAIMPERLARTDAFTQITEMVGSGPFRFVAEERMAGARAVYRRFEGYKPHEGGTPGWTGGPKIAHFDRVEWNVVPDPSTAAAALRSGEADWWEFPLADLIPLLRRDRNVRVEVTDPTGLIVTARMNAAAKPFENPAIRRAVLGAVNQKDVMEALAGSDPNLYRTPVGVFCPGTPMASDAGMGTLTGRRDPAAARRALEAAGYAGEKMVLLSGTDQPTSKVPAEILADVMQRIGMSVDYQATEWGTVVQRRASREPTDRGGWSMYCSAWSGTDHMDPAGHLMLRGNAGFFGWLQSDRLETLRDQWFAAPDLAAQQAVARDIQRQALEVDVPYLPLGQFIQPTAYRGLTGVLPGFAAFWNVRRA